MSGRISEWAYTLIEYGLAYESLKSMKDQVVANFIVEHRIDDILELDVSYITITAWTLYFDGLVYNKGQGIVIVLVSPRNATFNFSSVTPLSGFGSDCTLWGSPLNAFRRMTTSIAARWYVRVHVKS
jgi:hypothetical protein